MESTIIGKATLIESDQSKLELLNTLESHRKIYQDALDYYELKSTVTDKEKKIQSNIMDQRLIQLEADFLLEINFSKAELNEYATLNANLMSSILFGNGLLSKNNYVYKPVFSDLANLLKKICSPKNIISDKFRESWNSNDFGFTIDELLAFNKNKKPDANLSFVHKNLIRYFIKRRLASISTVELDIWLDGAIVDDTKNSYAEAYSVKISSSMETAYYDIKADKKPIRKLASLAPRESLTDKKSEYDIFNEFRSELHNIDTKLKDISRNLVNDNAAKEQYIQSYSELIRQKNAFQFMIKKKAEELSYIQIGYTLVKDNIYENKSMAKKAAAKAILTTAGVRLGKSIYNELVGKGAKNEWAVTGELIAYDLAQAATTGIATLLLGPLGGTISSTMFGFLRPEMPKPDPHMDKMIEIQKDINKGFDKLSLKIDTLERKISDDIENMGNLIIDYVKINALLNDFKTDIKDIYGNLNKIEKGYVDIFDPKSRINEMEFLHLSDQIEQGFDKILVTLFNNKAALNRKNKQDLLKINPDSIISEIMLIYAQDSDSSKNFYEVCGILCPLLDSVQFVAQEYLKLRPQYHYVLSALALFYETSNKNEIQTKLLKSHGSELETKLEFYTCFFLIHQNVIGENNLAFYNLMKEYWMNSEKLNIIHGFALFEKNGKSKNVKQYNYNFTNNVYDAKGQFDLVEIDKNHLNRYYLMPHRGAKYTKDATLYTFQNNEVSLPIDVKFGLLPNDEVKIVYESKFIIAHLLGTNHEVFAGSIEHAIRQLNKDLDLQNSCLSLVKRNYWLKSVINSDNKLELQVHKIENGASKMIPGLLTNYKCLKPSLVNVEEVSKAIYGQFKVAGEYKYLYELEPGKTANYFLKNAIQKLEEVNLKESSVCILESENRRYMVKHCFFNFEGKYYDARQKDFVTNKEARTLLFDREKLVGSVFKNYNNFNSADTELRMQDDGNFVLYDSNNRALAATDTFKNPEDTFLYLTNDGRLVLIANKTREIKTTIDIKNEGSNRINQGEQLNFSDFRISSNGTYKLKFCELRGSHGYPLMNLLLSNGLNYKRVFVKDYQYYHDRSCRNFIRFENGQLIHTVWLSSDYNKGPRDEKAIKCTKEAMNSYLEISDDGKLNVCRDDNFIETIFDFHA